MIELFYEDFTGEVYNARNPDGTIIPEIERVDGWQPFWREYAPDVIFRPEMKVIDAEAPYLNPPRTNGIRGLKVFKLHSRHDAGYLKQFAIPAGINSLLIEGRAHYWYSRRDDPTKSEYYTDDGVWHTLTSGEPGASVMVGVDPQGGVNPWSDDVIWAEYTIYDHFDTVWLEVSDFAPLITVFIRSQQLWPFKHTDCYWADVTITGDIDPEPEPVECPGEPREDFRRTYNVIPQDATEERAVEIFREGWRRSKETSGGSPDDAMLGHLSYKLARLYDIPADRQPDFIDFRDLYYPDALIEFAGDSPTPLPVCPVTVFSQRDPAWASIPLDASPYTVGTAGCAVVSAAMIGSLEDDATPAELVPWLNANGGFDTLGRLYWQKPADYYGLDFVAYHTWRDVGQVADMAIVTAALERGPAIIQVDFYPSTSVLDSHFVVAYGWDGGDILIADPWTGTTRNLLASYGLGSLAESIKALVDYRLDTDPEPPVTPIRPAGSSSSTILLHEMQTAPAGVQKFLQTTHPPAHLVVGNGGGPQLVQARGWWPTALLCYRRVEDGLDVYNPAQAAEYVQRYIVDLQGSFNLADFSKPPIYLVSINEKYECRHATQNAACAAWDIAFMNAVEQTGLNLKAIVYTAPVGNPEPDAQDLTPLLPMVARACAGKHVLGKHCYYASAPDQPLFYQSSWLWYGGRFAKDDDFFAAHGLHPYWMLSEGGSCQATINADGTVSLNPGCGWKGCGTIQRYRDELLWCHAWYKAWNAAHQGRLLGVNLFTTGGWWDLFDLQGADLDVVTAGLAGVL